MRRLHFLDGLRGWAALVVVFCHTLQTWLMNPQNMQAHGLKPFLDAINSTPLGALIDGQLAVYVFFSISGMALGYSIISAPGYYRSLANMALVRYPRLTVPILASCTISYVIFIAGGYHNVPAAALSHSAWLDSFFRFQPHASDMPRFSFFDVFFHYDGTRSWNSVLWTMSIELIWSFALFALLLLPWRLARIPAAFVLAAYFFNDPAFGFFAGYLLAEFVLATRETKHLRLLREGAGAIAILAAFTLATLINWPAGGPLTQFFLSVGGRNLIAITLLAGVTLSAAAQNALSAPPSRFVGRISFSLYLVHLLVICSVASALFVFLQDKAAFPLQAGLTLATVLILSIGAAVLFERVFEDLALKQVKRAIGRLFGRGNQPPASAPP